MAMASAEKTVKARLRYKYPEEIFEESGFMEIGDKVPEFAVANQDDEAVSLKDFRGKPVVLFFFPKADTPG
jgi:peroxiredoxin